MSHGDIFSTCTILEILPAAQVGNAAVGSALCNGRGREDGSNILGHKRPVIVMLPGLFICLGVSGNLSPSQVSRFSFISLQYWTDCTLGHD